MLGKLNACGVEFLRGRQGMGHIQAAHTLRPDGPYFLRFALRIRFVLKYKVWSLSLRFVLKYKVCP